MFEELGTAVEAPEVDAVVDEHIEDAGVEATDEAPLEAEGKEETPGDWRKVPAELKDFFKTPAGKAAKDAWFERNAYKEKFPEGIKQVNELTAFLDEHGGREGLTTALGELTGKAAELDGIAAKMANGDASLVSDLVQSSPEGFAKLAPVVAEQWAKIDPEGWGAAMSGVFAQTIASNGVPMFLEKMGMLLEFGKVEDASAMLTQLKGWANGFSEKASAPRTTQAQQPDKFADREQQLNQREQRAYEGDVEKEVDAFRTPAITKELESFFKRRPNDSDAKDLAIQTVRTQVLQRLHADEGFKKSVNAFHARKDKAGALQLIKSRETAAITDIAPKVGRTIFGNPATVKVATPAPVTRTPAPKVTGRTDPRDSIFERILSR